MEPQPNNKKKNQYFQYFSKYKLSSHSHIEIDASTLLFLQKKNLHDLVLKNNNYT